MAFQPIAQSPDTTNSFSKGAEFVAQYSMGPYDYARYNEWIKRVEESSAIINSCQVPTLEMVQRYFAELNVLYKSWRILMYDYVKTELDAAMLQGKKDKRAWEKSIASGAPLNNLVKFRLIDNLDSIHTKLMEIKQLIGLGIMVKRKMNMTDRIKAGVRGINDMNDLPEA
jgi:hypothetical protein